MSKLAFRIYLGVLGLGLLFSLSPFAVLGGFAVAAFLFVPLMLALGFMGVDVSGHTINGLIFSIFSGFTVTMALIAFWLFYRAAAHSDEGQSDRARASAAFALTLIVIPAVIYLCYKALPGI